MQSYYATVLAIVLLTTFANSGKAATINLDPKAGFLRTENDLGALEASPIDLTSLGFVSGDVIKLTGQGSYDRGGGFGTFFDLIGVFSSTNALLAGNLLSRVPNAIDAGIDVSTLPTNFGGSPTNISEDFLISNFDGSNRGVTLTIPTNATFLFVGTNDSYFEDNIVIDSWALNIESVPSVPLPASLPLLLAGLAGFGLVRKSIRRH